MTSRWANGLEDPSAAQSGAGVETLLTYGMERGAMGLRCSLREWKQLQIAQILSVEECFKSILKAFLRIAFVRIFDTSHGPTKEAVSNVCASISI